MDRIAPSARLEAQIEELLGDVGVGTGVGRPITLSSRSLPSSERYVNPAAKRPAPTIMRHTNTATVLMIHEDPDARRRSDSVHYAFESSLKPTRMR
jgi:hypothetical protein